MFALLGWMGSNHQKLDILILGLSFIAFLISSIFVIITHKKIKSLIKEVSEL